MLITVLLFRFIQVFQGNSERQIVVINRFRSPIRARFIRMYPQTWHGHISMRLELYGCSRGKKLQVPCQINISEFRMFSWWLRMHFSRGLLDWKGTFRVSLENVRVNSSKIAVFVTNESYSEIQNKECLFYHSGSQKKKRFLKKNCYFTWCFFVVRQIFLIDVNGIMFFLGHMCNRPLGMMTGAIKNSAITASSMWDKHHAPFLARLNARRMGRYQSAWSAR